jgi:hypothetical protein
MNGPRIGRRAALLAMLAGLAACAAPPPAPVRPADPDPDPEQVYTPGPIPWADLTEEHIRRARQGLTRLGEEVPDEATLQARWMLMSPAQQRFMIRRPPPPPRPAPVRGGAARTRGAPVRAAAPRRPAPPARRAPPPQRR